MRRVIYMFIASMICLFLLGCDESEKKDSKSFSGVRGILDSGFSTDGIVVHNSAAGGNGSDSGEDLAVDENGNIFVTGYSYSLAGQEMAIWKYTETGVLATDFGFANSGILWHNSAAGGNGFDVGHAIALDASGNIYVAGASYNGANSDMVIWKYTEVGDHDSTFGSGGIVVHNNAAGGSGNDYGYAIALDGSGNVFVAGCSAGASGLDMVIWKYTSAGVLDTNFGSSGIVVHNGAAGGDGNDVAYDIALDSSGNVYVAGESFNGSDYDMTVWKYTSEGSLDAEFGTSGIFCHDNAAGGDGDDYGNALVLDGSGNIYVAGTSKGGVISTMMGPADDMDMTIWKLTSAGDLSTDFNTSGFVTHDNAAGGSGPDIGNDIGLDEAGNILVAGQSYDGYEDMGALRVDMAIWKYTTSGVLDSGFGTAGIVIQQNAAGGDGDDAGLGICFDDDGRMFISGYGLGANRDMILYKYR